MRKKKENYKTMGLPTVDMLILVWDWWIEYRRLIMEGRLKGKYRKDWWLNKKTDEFDLFLRWLLDLVNEAEEKKNGNLRP